MLTKGSSEGIPESQQVFRTSGRSYDSLQALLLKYVLKCPAAGHHPAVRLLPPHKLPVLEQSCSAFGIQASQVPWKAAPKSLELITIL